MRRLDRGLRIPIRLLRPPTARPGPITGPGSRRANSARDTCRRRAHSARRLHGRPQLLGNVLVDAL
eukprot:7400452-Alexandrium_andersonii.AAC.1